MDPPGPWPPIDPQGWVTERSYNDRRLDASLARFVDERDRSVAWLRGLAAVELDRVYTHPTVGPIKAGDLLHAWLAHDLIQIRQLTRLHYRWLKRSAAPYRLDYAGPF